MNLFDFIYDRIYFPKEHKIRFFEAFSGIGCQAMALKKITDNFEIVGISEIDKYALQSYKAIHGDVKNYGGIGSFERFPKDIDICTWSFPCQDISLAGKQRGLVDGSRSNYGYEFLETVKRTPKEERPKVLIMENVKALFSDKFKEDWREIQRRLGELGYMSYAQVLNGKDYGVAQNRERIFIVSVMGEYNYVFPETKPLTKRLKDYLEDNVDEKYYLNEKMIAYISKNGTKNFNVDTKINLDICRPITTDQNKRAGTTNYISKSLPDNFDLKVMFNTNPSGVGMNGNIYDSNWLAPTLTTNKGEGLKILIHEKTIKGYAEAYEGDGVYINRPHQKRGVVQHEMIQTIKTSIEDIGVVVNKENHISIRKLTPRECWRLMGISDEDFDKAQASGMSNAQLYKQAGNGIVVDVFEAILSQMIERNK